MLRKSAPEISKEKQYIPRTQAVNTQSQINLFVSETNLDVKANPITSISIHQFAQENIAGKSDGSKRKEAAQDISSYTPGLIQTCSMKAATSQVSLPMSSGKWNTSQNIIFLYFTNYCITHQTDLGFNLSTWIASLLPNIGS